MTRKEPPVTHNALGRKRVHDAQDSYVRRAVDEPDGKDDDTDSVGPDKRNSKDKEMFHGEFDWDPDAIFPLMPASGDETDRRKRLKHMRTLVSNNYDEVDHKARDVDIREYDFPFENLAFEGGGNKGLAYCGARYAGASAGAMTAALLSVGYNSYEIEEFLSQDLSKIFLDHSCGFMSLLPNLLTGYGWNPGKRIYKWFGQQLEAKTGNADVTFAEILERFGKELCVVATNLNMMNAEYFHPKTSPDMPVRMAATEYRMHGEDNTYVDGGLLCNYPINCYDGWWLSMKMEDSFLNRLQPLENFPKLFEKKERFGTYNEHTLGFLLYADNERDILRDILQQRKIKKKKKQEQVKLEHIRNLHAVSAFLKVLKKHNKDNDDKINKTELKNALNDVYYHEIVHFIERTGVSLQARFLGYQRKEIKGLFSFFDTLQSALLTNVKRIVVEERDIERTIGINTGHVGTSDFTLEQADRDFVIEQGKRSAETFLRYYVVKNDPPKKKAKQVKSEHENVTGHGQPHSDTAHAQVNGTHAEDNGDVNSNAQSKSVEVHVDVNGVQSENTVEVKDITIEESTTELEPDTDSDPQNSSSVPLLPENT
ncbi:463L-like protein [Mya arenaria]|uniref:463L-like protein n=1 Tax=Mya arenaria TaxID=6604 RepID=A0ABY7DBS9_MYAAR|nr:463L-like protein [Mya arenaria]